MNNKLLYVLLGIMIVCAMGYYTFQPCSQIQGNIEAKKQAITDKENAERARDLAKAAYERHIREQEQKKKMIELNRGKLKEIYEFDSVPSYMDIDSLFGKILHDIINMAKKNGLKIRSMEFFANTEREPLVLGRDIPLATELENLKSSSKNLGKNSQGEQQAEQPQSSTGYKAYQVDFGFLSSYTNLNKFIETLGNYKYLIKVKKLETFPYPDNPKILMSNVSLVLYVKIK